MANFVTNEYKLDITPQGNYPVVYLSQFENGLVTAISSTYPDLQDKPQINGVTLAGNKTLSDLNFNALTTQEIESILV